MPPGITNFKTPYAVGRVRGLKVGNARWSKIKWLKTCVFRRTFAHWRSIPSQRCIQHVIIIRKPSEKNLCRCVYTKLYRGISRKFWCMQVCGCVCLSVLSSVVRHSRTGASTKFCSPPQKKPNICACWLSWQYATWAHLWRFDNPVMGQMTVSCSPRGWTEVICGSVVLSVCTSMVT